MIRLLVDGVAFQRGTASAGAWEEVLAKVASEQDMSVLLLDRGSSPLLQSVQALPFPAHLGQEGAADSLLIQRICDLFEADVFLSTGGTSAITTPAVMVLPHAVSTFPPSEAGAIAALAQAQRYVCTDAGSGDKLLATPTPRTHVAVCRSEPAAIAASVVAQARALQNESPADTYRTFLHEWRRIRKIEAAVAWDGARTRERMNRSDHTGN